MGYEEIVETAGEFRVRLAAMEGAENPREDGDYHAAGVVTVYAGHYISTADPAEDERVTSAWARLDERYGWREAVPMLERYVRILGGVSLLDTPNDGAVNLWYILPDRFREVMLTGEFDAERALGILRSERDEYRQWCEGDVWGYVVERQVEWSRVTGVFHADDEQTMETWEEVDSLWGLFGREYAESEARAALKATVEGEA